MHIRQQCKITSTKSDDYQLNSDNFPNQSSILDVDRMTGLVEVYIAGKLRFSHCSQ